MLSKEEISEVISYCQEHGCSYKDRLTELGIAEWKFYDSKYRYAIQERKIKESGQFLQLKPSSDGSFVPFPSLDSPKTGRKEDKHKCARASSCSIGNRVVWSYTPKCLNPEPLEDHHQLMRTVLPVALNGANWYSMLTMPVCNRNSVRL